MTVMSLVIFISSISVVLFLVVIINTAILSIAIFLLFLLRGQHPGRSPINASIHHVQIQQNSVQTRHGGVGFDLRDVSMRVTFVGRVMFGVLQEVQGVSNVLRLCLRWRRGRHLPRLQRRRRRRMRKPGRHRRLRRRSHGPLGRGTRLVVVVFFQGMSFSAGVARTERGRHRRKLWLRREDGQGQGRMTSMPRSLLPAPLRLRWQTGGKQGLRQGWVAAMLRGNVVGVSQRGRTGGSDAGVVRAVGGEGEAAWAEDPGVGDGDVFVDEVGSGAVGGVVSVGCCRCRGVVIAVVWVGPAVVGLGRANGGGVVSAASRAAVSTTNGPAVATASFVMFVASRLKVMILIIVAVIPRFDEFDFIGVGGFPWRWLQRIVKGMFAFRVFIALCVVGRVAAIAVVAALVVIVIIIKGGKRSDEQRRESRILVTLTQRRGRHVIATAIIGTASEESSSSASISGMPAVVIRAIAAIVVVASPRRQRRRPHKLLPDQTVLRRQGRRVQTSPYNTVVVFQSDDRVVLLVLLGHDGGAHLAVADFRRGWRGRVDFVVGKWMPRVMVGGWRGDGIDEDGAVVSSDGGARRALTVFGGVVGGGGVGHDAAAMMMCGGCRVVEKAADGGRGHGGIRGEERIREARKSRVRSQFFMCWPI
mmetsp:Transcript_10173/g.21121  ORF Transcript_10173/g.21121 Transcript_10173/m.21121 type:complete len:645 (-) Transcript_10173:4-1938(-)